MRERGWGVRRLAVTCAGLWAAVPPVLGAKALGRLRQQRSLLEVSDLHKLKLGVKY